MAPADQNTARSPDEYRMSLGDHLEELRKRIIYALLGFIIAAGACAYFGNRVIQFFCQPLVNVLVEQHISPQLYFTSAGDAFTVYLKITMIVAAVIAGPWIIWQLWLFVAAGLYPKEQRMVGRIAPLSVMLLIAGVTFCYYIVLPLSLRFFIGVGDQIPLTLPSHAVATTMPATAPTVLSIPTFPGDPADPVPFQMWFDAVQQRLKFAVPDDSGALKTMVVHFGPQSLISPLITLPDYIDMVLLWLTTFALSFQLPLVTMSLIKLGVVTSRDLGNLRKYVYVGLAILSSILMPDVFSGTLMLMIPLCLLYEFGILLGRISIRNQQPI